MRGAAKIGSFLVVCSKGVGDALLLLLCDSIAANILPKNLVIDNIKSDLLPSLAYYVSKNLAVTLHSALLDKPIVCAGFNVAKLPNCVRFSPIRPSEKSSDPGFQVYRIVSDCWLSRDSTASALLR